MAPPHDSDSTQLPPRLRAAALAASGARPLTDAEVLEHALRAVVRDCNVGGVILHLQSKLGRGSVLDMRAAEMLERIDREEGER